MRFGNVRKLTDIPIQPRGHFAVTRLPNTTMINADYLKVKRFYTVYEIFQQNELSSTRIVDVFSKSKRRKFLFG